MSETAPPAARLTGTGMAVPDRVVDNDLLARCMDTSDEWIVERTGIHERRVSPDTYRLIQRLAESDDPRATMDRVRDEGLDGDIDSTMTVTDLAERAARDAVDDAGTSIEAIDCIIESSTIPDYAYPHTGCVLQGRFGLTSTPVFNLQQGCSGFVYGLAMADHFLRTGLFGRCLVIGAEMLTPVVDYTTRGRSMAVLFADGAGAAVVEPTSEDAAGEILSHHLYTDGTKLDALSAEVYGTSTFPIVSKKKIDEGRTLPRMDGRKVFVQAVTRLSEVTEICLEENDIGVGDVDLFIYHQANARIIDAVAEKMDVPDEKTFNNVQKYGNTAAASVPMCFHEAVQAGRVDRGDLVFMAAFGTGFSWGASLLRW